MDEGLAWINVKLWQNYNVKSDPFWIRIATTVSERGLARDLIRTANPEWSGRVSFSSLLP